jgi:hypothetical protein
VGGCVLIDVAQYEDLRWDSVNVVMNLKVL